MFSQLRRAAVAGLPICLAGSALQLSQHWARPERLDAPEASISGIRPHKVWQAWANDLPRQLCKFIDASPSPHHVVANAKELLVQHGFEELREEERWTLRPGGKYFVNRNNTSGTSLAAFAVGGKWQPGDAFAIVATHVDSPCLRLKPISKRTSGNFLQVGVECYGGGLWHTWFNRDLGFAGRVMVRTGPETIETRLVNVNEPMLHVPSLAVHYKRQNPFDFNLDQHLLPIMGTAKAKSEQEESLKAHGVDLNEAKQKSDAEAFPPGRSVEYWPTPATTRNHEAMVRKVADELGVPEGRIVDFDLCLYDVQPSTVGGAHDEFIFAPRLDNLMMTYCGLIGFTRSLADESALSNESSVRMIALFDHEEIGSKSTVGALSTLIPHMMQRITDSPSLKPPSPKGGMAAAAAAAAAATTLSSSLYEQSLARSFIVSADMTHAQHPSYPTWHDPNHAVGLNDGLCVSSTPSNVLMRNMPGAVLLREVACRAGGLLPGNSTRRPATQMFTPPNEVACGETLGPQLGTLTGIRTVDVGNAQLSMHSAREMAGAWDVDNAVALLQGFYLYFTEVDAGITLR